MKLNNLVSTEPETKLDVAVGPRTARRIIWQVLQPVAWTIVASLYIPIVLYFVLWQLQAVGESQLLAANLAHGLASMLPAIVMSMILGRAFSRNGLACGTLGWPNLICEYLQRALSRTSWVVCPLLAVCESLKQYAGGIYSDSLGRLGLVSAMLVLGMVLWQTSRAIVRYEASRDQRRPTIWFAGGKGFQWIVTLLPVSLAILSVVGFRFAAEQLGIRILWSLLGGMAILLCWSLMLHVFGLYRQRLVSQIQGNDSKARQDLTDLHANTKQVTKLLNVFGLICMMMVAVRIWAQVLPVSELLGRIHLWDGAAGTNGVAQSITPQHFLLASIVLMVALSISRNLSGLIELTLPARLPLDKGGRFAITFVARYVVGFIGLMQAASLVGFSWDRVQWLAAGLTVGLGFGLQEVFANLVSGLIILIERPVRVGDSISVNNVSGTVTKMALRATTIMDSDRREWIVPNKKFITDDVMNWTLTDSVSRAVFPISVAHGSNTRLVHQILLEVAKRQSLVMDFPEPSAVLVKIGPHSLDYELRVYLASRSSFTALQNELHIQLDEALRSAGIDVAISASDAPKIVSGNGQRKAA